MPRTDLLLAFAALLFFLILPGCNGPEPAITPPPKEFEAVAQPFLDAATNGNYAAAEKLVIATAKDELKSDFAGLTKELKALPKLTPRLVRNYNVKEKLGASTSQIFYAARSKGKWTTLEMRLDRDDNNKIQVHFWRIHKKAPHLVIGDPESAAEHMMRENSIWIILGIALFGLAFIGLIIWIVKRKPNLVAPEMPIEHRAAAKTMRDPDIINDQGE